MTAKGRRLPWHRETRDWWSRNLSPWSGCEDLALPPGSRSAGCRACWLPAMLSGPRGRGIHGDHAPHEIVLHPGRLAQALRMRKPQRCGWINGEVADVGKMYPEYLAACVGVAVARPDHGFGVPTSDPAEIVEWARWVEDEYVDKRGSSGVLCYVNAAILMQMHGVKKMLLPRDDEWPPPNWLWLLSISTQAEADERLPYGRELGRMGWPWGVHAEPLLEMVSIIPDAYGMDLRDAPSWIVAGAAKGHTPTAAELPWYELLRDQAAYAGVPFWLKTPAAIPGETHVGLPAGWPVEV